MQELRGFYYSVVSNFFSLRVQRALKVLIPLFFICITTHAFADDILSGTGTNLIDTLKGTGRKYLYIGEFIASILIYIKTKNVAVLIGIVIVAIVLELVLKMIGA